MGKQSAVLAEAKRLWDLGFAIHWLRPKSKVPVESGWTTGPRKSWEYLEKTFKPDYNVGVRLGTPSKIGKRYLFVIDVDVKSKLQRHLTEALEAAKALVGETICPVVLSGRGQGSCHFYGLTKEPFKTFNLAVSTEKVKVKMPSKKPSKAELAELSSDEIKVGIRIANAWEISLYSDGRQVVLPPSIHPDSGKGYKWETDRNLVVGLPELDVTQLKPQASPNDAVLPVSDGAASDPQAVSTPGLTGFQVEPVDLGWIEISPEVRAAILDGVGVTDRSAYLLRASSALISAGLTQNEVLSVLTDPKTFLGACAYEHAKTKNRKRAAGWVYRYTVDRVARERSGEGVFTKADALAPPRKLSKEEMAANAAEIEELREWRQDLDRGRKGIGFRNTLKNIDLILTNKVDGTVFVEDLFASRIEYGCDTPWGGKAKDYIQDIDMIRIKRWFGTTEFGIEPNTNAILEATSLLAHRHRIHPIRDWLNSLKWDGVPRANTWVKDYCKGVAPEPYLSDVSRKFLVAMVKRIFEPGCQWDYVLVLEGDQGKFKSSIARALAGDKWFMDNLPDLKDKDSMLNLQGKWLIELGELADVKRADYNLVKAYLVRRVDTVRPHYGRLKTDVPRQSVFIGTINEGQYLKDPTGNRRYWPVKVGLCDVAALKAVRDQLFAEAMHLYKSGTEVLTLLNLANEQATEAQEERRIDDDESEMRDAFLTFWHSKDSAGFRARNRFKAYELTMGVSAPWGRWATAKGGHVAHVAAHVLTRLGFERYKSSGERFWRRKNQPNSLLD